MIHPNLATMLAVVTTDYPLEPGEAHEFLRPAVEESFNAISVDGECSTNDTVVLLANGAGAARRATDPMPSRRRCSAVCADLAAPDRRRRRGRDRPGRDRRRAAPSTSAQADAIARRIATSPLVKTALFGRDAELGPRARRGGLGAVQRRLRARSTPTALTLAFNGAHVFDAGAPQRREPQARRRRRAASSSTSASGDGVASLPDHRPLLRLRPHQRGLPDVSSLVVKCRRRRRASRGRRSCRASLQAGHGVCVVHGAGPADLRRDGTPRPARSRSSAAAA